MRNINPNKEDSVKKIMLAIVIIASTSVSHSQNKFNDKWIPDGHTYKYICDTSGLAAFMVGFANKSQCSYIDKDFYEYMASHDQPCDQSLKGQFLRGFLGKACDRTKSLKVESGEYKLLSQCPSSSWQQFKAGFLGQDPCNYKYEIIQKVESQKTPNTGVQGTQQ